MPSLRIATALPLLLALWACGGGGVDVTPQKLTLTSAATVPNDGTRLSLHIEATDGLGSPGSGTVELRCTHGKFYGFSGDARLEMKNGQAVVDFLCDIEDDAACLGPQVVSAEWREMSAFVSFDVTETRSSP